MRTRSGRTILQNIEWADENPNSNIIVFRYPMQNNQVNRGSNLTVRESQAAIFSHQGKMADVFLPGRYKLETDNIPLLTKLMSWKYGFENPFISEIFYVSTRLFKNQKWGTSNPIMIRCKEFGPIRVRAFGSYAFRVADPYIFMTELSGTGGQYTTNEITDYIRSMLITCISQAVGESQLPILDLAANLIELGKVVKKTIDDKVRDMGLQIAQFNVENFSLPEELQKAMDGNAALGMQRGNWDMQMQSRQMDIMGKAASNPGAGNVMAPMMGMGMGMGMGNMMGQMMGQGMQNVQGFQQPGGFGPGAAQAQPAATPHGAPCPKCQKPTTPGAGFCMGCGQSLAAVACPKCQKPVTAGAKFCMSCGQQM